MADKNMRMKMLEKWRLSWFCREEMIFWVPPVFMGLLLRFWSLYFGLPNTFRPDEDMVVLPSLAMVGGDLDPHDYTYPTLYKYILVLVFRVCMMLGVGAQESVSAWQYAAYGFFVDGTFFFQTARVVSALFGVLTICVVYRIGREGYGRFVGAAGAWFVSVSVLHVRDSHFGVTDVPSVALLMLGVLWCVRIAQRGELRDYVWAGVFIGLSASTKYGSAVGLMALGIAHLSRLPDGASLWTRWAWDRSVWLGVLCCVAVFGVTSPYLLWNIEGFIRDFGFQMRHVYEYGHGENLGPGWLYHPSVTLRYGLGVLVLLSAFGGLIVSGLRRNCVDWVLLGLFVAFFVVTGSGKTVIFRYALPLVPLCGVFAGVFVDRMRQLSIFPQRFMGVVGAVLVLLCVAEPIYASVRLNVLLGKKDTRAQAREWVEKHIPEGTLIANVGGLYGDVHLKNRNGLGWWVARYYWWFPALNESELVRYLATFKDALKPYYSYDYHVGHPNLDAYSHGDVKTFEDKDLVIWITHEHPLPYSEIEPEFLTELEKRAEVMATFRPADSIALNNALFDMQDAFYYPMGRFGNVERGGPVVKVWHIPDREPFVLEQASDPRMLIRDTFFFLGNGSYAKKEYKDALAYYDRALKLDAKNPHVRVFMAATYIHQEKYQEAADQIRMAIAYGQEIGNLERVLSIGGAISGEVYARMGAVCAMAGYYKEATIMYERAVRMGVRTVPVFNNLGVMYDALKKYEEAIEAFETVLVLDPNHSDAQHNLRVVKRRLEEANR